jgi:four helix bundle protein
MRDYRKLRVWKESHQLALDVYRATGTLPKEERYGLGAQLRRAAASIPSNLAEGCGRDSQKEFAHFLQVAIGSANELEYQILLARDLGMVDPGAYSLVTTRVEGVRQMLSGLRSRVRNTLPGDADRPFFAGSGERGAGSPRKGEGI